MNPQRTVADCVGKQRFSCFSDAERVARLSAGRQHIRMRPYKCHVCQGFHYGSTIHRREKRP